MKRTHSVALVVWTVLLCLLISRLCARAAPVQVDSFAAMQDALAAGCETECSFQFSQATIQISEDELLQISSSSISIAGQAGGGTTLVCINDNAGGRKAIISITGATATSTSVSLQDLNVTQCQGMDYFLSSSGASVLLTNVHFISNAPAISLLRMDMSTSAQNTLTLSRVRFENNQLTAGSHLLDVRNAAITVPGNPTTQSLLAFEQAIRETVCGTSNVLNQVPFVNGTVTEALMPELVERIMDTAYKRWIKANQLIDAGPLSGMLVPVQMDGLVLLNNTAFPVHNESALPPTPIRPDGSNLPSIVTQPWINASLHDFIYLAGVNLSATQITFVGNKFARGNVHGRFTCRSLLHLTAGAASFTRLTVENNTFVNGLRVDTAVGSTKVVESVFANNTLNGCPVVRFEGHSVVLNDRVGARAAACENVPTLAQMEGMYQFWQQLALLRNEYDTPSGAMKPIGMIKLKEYLQISAEALEQRCALYRDLAGLPKDVFPTYQTMVHSRFLAYLENAVSNKALNFAYRAPLLLHNTSFTSHDATDTSLFHITGSYMNGTHNGTFLTARNISFTANTLSPGDHDRDAVRWDSLFLIEQAFADIYNTSFVSNTNASAMVLDRSAATIKEVRIFNNSAFATPLLYAGNITATPTVLRPYMRVSGTNITQNSASGPVAVVYNAMALFEQVSLVENVADVRLAVWNRGVEDAQKMASGIFYTVKCNWPRFQDVLVHRNAANISVVTFNITTFNPIRRLYCQFNIGTCCHVCGTFARDKDLDGEWTGSGDFSEISASYFVGNKATTTLAAGLQLTNGDWLKFNVYDSSFIDNMGMDGGPEGTYGGALGNVPDYSFGKDKKAAMVRLHGLNFTRNKAFAGGAIYAEKTGFTLWNSTFQDNEASRIGGAILCTGCHWDYLFNNVFDHNSAPQGGAIVATVPERLKWVLMTTATSMAMLANRFINNVASGKRTDPYNAHWGLCPAGGGGALCMMSTYEEKSLEHVYIQGNEFINNTGTWGGAALVNGWRTPHQPPHCVFVFSNNTFMDNTITDGAGPILFYNSSGTVCLDCSNRNHSLLDLSFMPKNVSNPTDKDEFVLQDWIPAVTKEPLNDAPLISCSQAGTDSWHGNKMLGTDNYGQGDFGTFPTHMDVVFCESENTNCSRTSQEGPSGGRFHAKVTLVDADGLVVPNSPTNITVVISKADGADTGLLVYNWQPLQLSRSNRMLSNVSFQTLSDPNDTTYGLVFFPLTSEGMMAPVTLNLTVRKCFLGEHLGDMHTCGLCDKGSFTLQPHIPCLPCISGASCYSDVDATTIGRGLLVPQPGFWKSSPYSPIINRCPLSASCKVTSREANMERTTMLLELLANKTYPLTREQEQAFMDRQCARGFEGRLCGSCASGHGRTGNRCILCLGAVANTILLLLALVFLCVFVAMLSYNHAKAVLQTTVQSRMEAKNLVVQNHGDTLVSIIKVFVSYLQVLAIMKSVPISWPPALLRFISNIDVTSAPEWVSIDCSLPHADAQTKAIVRTTSAMFLPVVLIVVATAFWWVWSRIGSRRRRLQASGLSWTDFLVLTTIQICFTLYTFSTGATMNMFACTTVDKQPGDSTMMKLYKAADWTAGHAPPLEALPYWSQNYEQRCIKGSHAIVAFLLGLPWLLLFSLGFPVASAVVLHFHRNRLMAPHIMLKYGFLYQEYKDDLFAWESMIMLRKVSLLAVAIFLKPAGTIMQLTGASLLMYTCILLHELFRPYRANLVNGMERVSLFANMANIASLTFIAAGNATGLRITMTSIIFIINLSVISYFLYLVFHVSSMWFRQGGVFTQTVHKVAGAFSKMNHSLDCIPVHRAGKHHTQSMKDDTTDQDHLGCDACSSSCDVTPTIYTFVPPPSGRIATLPPPSAAAAAAAAARPPPAADVLTQSNLHAFVIQEIHDAPSLAGGVLPPVAVPPLNGLDSLTIGSDSSYRNL